MIRIKSVKIFAFLIAMVFGQHIQAQTVKDNRDGAFTEFGYRQGSVYRTASGKPGPMYWQNGADYLIDVALDETNHMIKGKITITYKTTVLKTLTLYGFIWSKIGLWRIREDN